MVHLQSRLQFSCNNTAVFRRHIDKPIGVANFISTHIPLVEKETTDGNLLLLLL